MTTDAAIFVERSFTLNDLSKLFLTRFPTGIVENASIDSIQLLQSSTEGYVELTDSSLSGNELAYFPGVWEQTGIQPEDALYCASPGFHAQLGSKPKQVSLWGNPKEFVKSVLMSFAENDRVWIMMNNGKITHGDELRHSLVSNGFFNSALPW